MRTVFLISFLLFLLQTETYAAFTWNPQYHACGEGNTGKNPPPSAVSPKISGSGNEQFLNTVNKRLGCCLNRQPEKPTTYDMALLAPSDDPGAQKFDCVENTDATTDFNALWASTSGSSNDDQLPNAVILRDVMGKQMTGFYTLDGQRCSQYGEVSGTAIQTGQVNPPVTQGIQMNKVNGQNGMIFKASTTTIPVPAGKWADYYVNKPLLNGPPTTALDRFKCPILVRAAMKVKCPSNPADLTSPRKTFEDSGSPRTKHCAVASSVMIHLRIEQIYEIGGKSKIKPYDTVVDSGKAASLDVSKLVGATTN